jgi:hypothetical protein
MYVSILDDYEQRCCPPGPIGDVDRAARGRDQVVREGAGHWAVVDLGGVAATVSRRSRAAPRPRPGRGPSEANISTVPNAAL